VIIFVLVFAYAIFFLPNFQQANGAFLDEIKKLTASDGTDDDKFGTSLALSGDTLVVGAPRDCPESAYVFSKDNGGKNNWGEVQKIVPSISIPCNTLFGFEVAISGDLVIVGAYLDDSPGVDSGSAYIFAKDQGGIDNWGQVKKLTAPDAADFDNFGVSVAIFGDTVVVGARLDDDLGDESGSAYIFAKDQGGIDNWGLVKKRVASDGVERDQFGRGVSIFGDDVVVGTRPDLVAKDVAYVFSRNQGGLNNWGEVKIISSADGSGNNQFATQTSMNGEFILVGGASVSFSYLFEKNLGGAENWGQRKKLSGAASSFGRSVSVFNDLVAVGSLGNAAFVFSKDQGGLNNWGEIKKLVSSDIQTGDLFGESIGISTDVIAVGAASEDGDGSNKGAVYLFDGSICSPAQSGDWVISENCTLLNDATILGDVIVQNNSVLVIPNLVSLDIDFSLHNLTVESGSGVLIQAGGAIT